jgi:hypothetical protein
MRLLKRSLLVVALFVGTGAFGLPCPKCGEVFGKIGGCDYVTCPRCKHAFCENCYGTHHVAGCKERRVTDEERHAIWKKFFDANLEKEKAEYEKQNAERKKWYELESLVRKGQGYQEAIDAAVKGAADKDKDVRSRALSLFRELVGKGQGYQEAADAAAKGMADPDLSVKRIANEVLMEIDEAKRTKQKEVCRQVPPPVRRRTVILDLTQPPVRRRTVILDPTQPGSASGWVEQPASTEEVCRQVPPPVPSRTDIKKATQPGSSSGRVQQPASTTVVDRLQKVINAFPGDIADTARIDVGIVALCKDNQLLPADKIKTLERAINDFNAKRGSFKRINWQSVRALLEEAVTVAQRKR